LRYFVTARLMGEATGSAHDEGEQFSFRSRILRPIIETRDSITQMLAIVIGEAT
jgi:hypothetical protein